MKSKLILAVDSLQPNWIDENRRSAYLANPQNLELGLGRLFAALEVIEGPQVIAVGVQNEHCLQWHSSLHAIDDGYSLLQALIRANSWQMKESLEVSPRPELSEENTSETLSRLLQRLSLQKWSVLPHKAAGQKWLANICLSPEKTQQFLLECRDGGKSLSGEIFYRVMKGVNSYFQISGQTLWMVSTQARHNEQVTSELSHLQSSYFLIGSTTDVSAAEFQKIYVQKLRSRDADANWKLGKKLARLPFWLLTSLTALDLYLLNRHLFGFYSHMGNSQREGTNTSERILWLTPVRKTRPISAVSHIWNGQLNLSLNLDECLGLQEQDVQKLADTIEGFL